MRFITILLWIGLANEALAQAVPVRDVAAARMTRLAGALQRQHGAFQRRLRLWPANSGEIMFRMARYYRTYFLFMRARARYLTARRQEIVFRAEVLEAGGRPLTGARVELWLDSPVSSVPLRLVGRGTTATGGRLSFHGLLPDRTYRLSLTHPEYRTQNDFFTTGHGPVSRTYGLERRAPPERRVRVIMIDESLARTLGVRVDPAVGYDRETMDALREKVHSWARNNPGPRPGLPSWSPLPYANVDVTLIPETATSEPWLRAPGFPTDSEGVFELPEETIRSPQTFLVQIHGPGCETFRGIYRGHEMSFLEIVMIPQAGLAPVRPEDTGGIAGDEVRGVNLDDPFSGPNVD